MNIRLPIKVLGLLAVLTLFVPAGMADGTGFDGNSSAGLSQRSIAALSHQSGFSGELVSMRPQTNVDLLKRKAVRIGPHPANAQIELTVSLKLRNLNKLRHFLRNVQNPRSANFHHFLTPEQFTEKYGPTKKQVASVVAFLESQDIEVKDVSPNRILIHTRGSTADYSHAFGVRINDYRMNGRRFSVLKIGRNCHNQLRRWCRT